MSKHDDSSFLELPPETPLPSLLREKSVQATKWLSIKHIYFTFIEYKNSEHTRIHHQALKEDMIGEGGGGGGDKNRNGWTVELVEE